MLFFPYCIFRLVISGLLLPVYPHIGFEALSLELLVTIPNLYSEVGEQDSHPRFFYLRYTSLSILSYSDIWQRRPKKKLKYKTLCQVLWWRKKIVRTGLLIQDTFFEKQKPTGRYMQLIKKQ